jgi:ferredoxin-NADP reductase/MOSC domain-containing protein YiiM/ferredoxin
MRVISVNVGLPMLIAWKGRMVSTSILKKPVDGRTVVRKLNLDGDAQADLNAHGGEHRAIFVYQKESYDYWSDYLRSSSLKYGQFGENLTVEGLSDADVCIGDRYQIGSAIFEVTQPRVTCYKIAISTGVPEMPALLVAHRRPGFYFRVLREGELCSGDTIIKLTSGPEEMSILEIDRLLYSSQHPSERLEKALKIPALSTGWQLSFRALLDSSVKGIVAGNAGLNQAAPIAWSGFKAFTVYKIREESIGVRSFELKSQDKKQLPAFLPGQHIALRIQAKENENPLIRMYSLCCPIGADFYRIAVKRETKGLASAFLHEQIAEGNLIYVSAPRGTFVLSEDDCPVILLSAGVGITPVLAMLFALSAARSMRKIYWIHSAQNKLHESFRGVPQELGKQVPNFRCIRIFSRPEKTDKQGVDYDLAGRLNMTMLEDLQLPMDGNYYLCGPSTYLSGTTEALKSLGVPEGKIKFEAFGNVQLPGSTATVIPHLPPDNTGTGPLINFIKSNLSFKWNTSFGSLLEAAEAADIPVHWSCRVGVCHRCESRRLDGQVAYDPTPLDYPATGNILLCCGKPITDIQLDL